MYIVDLERRGRSGPECGAEEYSRHWASCFFHLSRRIQSLCKHPNPPGLHVFAPFAEDSAIMPPVSRVMDVYRSPSGNVILPSLSGIID